MKRSKFARVFESLSPDDRRVYLDDPRLQVEAGEVTTYYDLLSNFEFLAAKIRHPEFGVEALIEDYYLMGRLDEELPGEGDGESESALKTIQRALQMSAHLLDKEKPQLGQLVGRLLSPPLPPKPPPYKYFWERLPAIGKLLPKYSSSHLLAQPLLKKKVAKKPLLKSHQAIEKLLKQAKQYQNTPWLRPLTANLTPHPGGHLIRTSRGAYRQGNGSSINIRWHQNLIGFR